MGKKIGKYELGKTLGTGNFSKVKLGTDCESGKQWAIKIIDKEQLQREHMEEQLKREIAIMKSLKHDNVVQLHEVMQTANHIYLVLELVTGGELFDRIVSVRKFDENTARKYFQQLILGVHYCHQQGIAHRDIKPENLLLDHKDILKISDFGLSNLQPSNRAGLLQTVCGTPNYVAPEVLKERGYDGFKADAWSCGIVLFVMLAGYLPFDDSNMNALFNKIERGDYRLARHFSEPIKDIISKLLLVDPTKRMTIDGAMQHPWFQVGFDAATATAGPKMTPSEQQLSTAITDAKEDGAAVDDAGGLDAFEVIGRLSQGTLGYVPAPANAAAAAPAPASPQAADKKSTFVLVRGAVTDIAPVFQSLKCNTKVANGEIKAFFNGTTGLMTFTATLSPTVLGDIALLEIKRGRGDVVEFRNLVKSFSTACGSRLRSALLDEPPV